MARGRPKATQPRRSLTIRLTGVERWRLEQLQRAKRLRSLGATVAWLVDQTSPLSGSSKKPTPDPLGIDEDTVVGELVSLGAPIVAPAVELTRRPEDVIADGLVLSHQLPVVVRAFPILLHAQRDNLAWDALREAASHRGEASALGMFLELVGELTGDAVWGDRARPLREWAVGEVRYFFEPPKGRHGIQIVEQNTPEVARRWRYRLNMPFETFASLFRK